MSVRQTLISVKQIEWIDKISYFITKLRLALFCKTIEKIEMFILAAVIQEEQKHMNMFFAHNTVRTRYTELLIL